MSGTLDIRMNKEDLQNAQRMLWSIENGFPKAYARALNKTATSVRTEMVKLIRDDYNYKVAAIRKRIVIKKAYPTDLRCSLISAGRHVNLTDIAGTNRTKKGVTVNVKKSTGRKLIPRTFIRRGVHSGKEIVLRRPGNPRGQHEKLWGRYGPAGSGGKQGSKARLDSFYATPVETIYNTESNWARLRKRADHHLKDHMAHETEVVLKGIA